MSTIDRVLACPTLPSLPAVAVEVLALTRSPSVSLTDISRVVQNDPGIAAKILKTVNSSFYGLQQPCSRLDRAMSYLGLQAVKSLVLGFSLVDATSRVGKGPNTDLKRHWRRTIFAAAAARQIAQMTRVADADECFTATLFQDIGVLACVAALGDEYASTLATAPDDHDLLCRHEREVFPFDHTTVGAELAKRWKLPDVFAEVIRKHHAPDSSGLNHAPVVRIAALSMYISEALSTPGAQALVSRVGAKAEAWFSIPAERVAEVLRATATSASELAKLFEQDVSIPDASIILAEAQETLVTGQLEMHREADRLKAETETDTLTGIWNRRRFDTDFAAALERARSSGQALSLVMLDADKFKSVNDTLGHAAGDAVLKQLAARARDTIGELGTVCRIGGEEFAIILPNQDRTQARQIAERLRTEIASTPMDLSEVEGVPPTLPVTASFGVASTEPGSDAEATTDKLLALADQAMYAAKSSGRNCVKVAEPATKPEAGRRATDKPGSPDPAAAFRSSDGMLRVLVVEDDPLAGKLLSMLLQRLPSTEVRLADSNSAATSILKAGGFTPGIAIIDNNLPDGLGVDLVPGVRELVPSIRKVIVMTATPTPALAQATIEAGAEAMVSKADMCKDIGRWVLQLLGQAAKAA